MDVQLNWIFYLKTMLPIFKYNIKTWSLIYFCKLHGTWQITLNAWAATAVGSPENQPELNPLPLKVNGVMKSCVCVCVCVCVFCRSFAIELNWIHCCCFLWVLCGLRNLDGGLLFLLQSVQAAFISRRAVTRGDGFSRLGVLLDVPTLLFYMIFTSDLYINDTKVTAQH